MSKIKKLILTPGQFFRDLLIKKYPIDYKNNIEPLAKEGGNSNNNSNVNHVFDPYYFNKEIDIVYTWVNYNDIEFQKNIKKYKKSDKDYDKARFTSYNELKFSLRSVEMFAPWVNKIYIVTNGQVPEYLDLKNRKLKIIFHDEIIEKQFLPTFNSHVIESCLHRINALSENYIYLNDDVLFTRPIGPNYFFNSNGLINLFATKKKIENGPLSSLSTDTENASKNSAQLLYRQTGYFCNFLFSHTFHPQLKSTNIQIEEIFRSEINLMKENKFRGLSDINIPTFLSHHFNYLKAKGVFRKTSCMYFNIRSPSALMYYNSLLGRKNTMHAPYSMCLNDKTSFGKNLQNYDELLLSFLNTYFNEKSSFEK
jgi:hypothetical protein